MGNEGESATVADLLFGIAVAAGMAVAGLLVLAVLGAMR